MMSYSAEIKCINCNKITSSYLFSFGSTVQQQLQKKKCQFCGCNIVKVLKPCPTTITETNYDE